MPISLAAIARPFAVVLTCYMHWRIEPTTIYPTGVKFILRVCNAAPLAKGHFYATPIPATPGFIDQTYCRSDAMSAFAWFFLSLRGRISRQEFWLGYVGIVVVALILMRVIPDSGDAGSLMSGDGPESETWQDASVSFGWLELISLALTWPIIAIYAKRLHDLDLTAWWLLLLPAVTFLAGVSMFGRLHVAAYCLLILVLGFLPGSHGANRFGDDPRAGARGETSIGDH
jgi:uncharacterized membrane protein YhaH (DUF805 family)